MIRLPLTRTALEDTEYPLEPEAAHYLCVVRRLIAGDTVRVFDGRGREATAVLEVDGARVLLRRVDAVVAGLSGADVRLVYALPRGEKVDDVVRHVTELGVSGVLLLAAERSVSRLDDAERADKKRSRWARIAAEAARQSGRADVPTVEGPTSLEAYLEASASRCRFVLHPEDGEPLPPLPVELGVDVAVGPEGGFSPRELALFERAGVRRITLRCPVLRTETAAIVAPTLVLAALGRL